MTTSDQRSSAGRTVSVRQILCPIDLSDFSVPVLAHAISLARWYDAKVTALHVFPTWMPPTSLAMGSDWQMQIPEDRESITKELQMLIEPFSSTGIAPPLQTAAGDAAKEIVRHADETDADLIVMGTHGRSGFDRFALGSVTEKVLRKASCPVLTLPPGRDRTAPPIEYRQILCPTDFSEASEHALDFAVSLALRAKSRLTALHVVEAIEKDPALHAPAYIVDIRRQQCQSARDFLHHVVSRHATSGCHLDEAVVLGKPHREIVRLAADRDADVIVMGVRGRGSADMTLFGSTTNQVVRHATCPVITLRG